MLDAGIALVATIGIAVLLFAVHEFGHYLCAAGVGIPREKMRIHLLSMPARVEFVGVAGFAETKQYLPKTNRRLTDTQAMFTIAAGGHMAELVTAVAITGVGLAIGGEWVAARFVLLSAFITASYLVVAVLSTAVLDNPFGDPVELWSRSVPGTTLLYGVLLVTLSVLIWLLAVPGETIRTFGLFVPLVFIPLAMVAAKSQ